MNRPKTTTKKKTLKKVTNTWDLEPASRTKARKVENPPLKTAGPKQIKSKNSTRIKSRQRTYFCEGELDSFIPSSASISEKSVSHVN